MIKKLSRRTLLRGATGAAIGLPFLGAMLGRNRSVAQMGEVPKRVVFFFTSCGVVPETWWPAPGGETDFVLPYATQPLEPFRDKILIPDGVAMETAATDAVGRNGHDRGTTHCLTARDCVAGPMGHGEFGHLWDGTAGGISIDQHMAQWVAAQPDAPPYPSLEFGVRAEGVGQALVSRISYRGEGQPVTPMNSAGQAFDRLFLPLAGTTEGQDARHRRRALVLGSVRGDLTRLRGRLGSEDRARVDAHMASIEALEQQLGELAASSCEVPERGDSNDYPVLGRLQLDLMVESLKCDLTRVASIQWRNGQSGQRHSWLGHMDGHHGVSHKTRGEVPDWDTSKTYERVATEIDRWYVEEFAYFLGRLDAVLEGDGTTLLDNTVVVWVNEQQRGIGNNHSWDRMPYIMAGSCGGHFRTGRRVTTPGAKHGELFVSLMQAFGMPDTTFGRPEHCTGPIAGLT